MGKLNVITRTGSRRTPETVSTVLIFSLTGVYWYRQNNIAGTAGSA
jgi:mitochondrial fission protein ELM1